jgi:hypothetical protein
VQQDTLRATAFGAQRSYCVHYLAALDFLEDKLPHAVSIVFMVNFMSLPNQLCIIQSAAATTHIQLLLDHLSEPLYRISDHCRLLQVR